MIYHVIGGTLSLTQSIKLGDGRKEMGRLILHQPLTISRIIMVYVVLLFVLNY